MFFLENEMIENSHIRQLMLFTQVMSFVENNSKDSIMLVGKALRLIKWELNFGLSDFVIDY